MKWHTGIGIKSKRLNNIIWHKFDVDWYWIQLKYEIKIKRYYESTCNI
jgi:hypothetical protein